MNHPICCVCAVGEEMNAVTSEKIDIDDGQGRAARPIVYPLIRTGDCNVQIDGMSYTQVAKLWSSDPSVEEKGAVVQRAV